MTPSPFDAPVHPPFPLASGRYDVLPGMTLFGATAVTGEIESGHFVIDRTFPQYLAERLDAFDEDPTGVYGTIAPPGSEAELALGDLLWRTLSLVSAEYPELVEVDDRCALVRALGIVIRRESASPLDVNVGPAGDAHPTLAQLRERILRSIAGQSGLSRLARALAVSVQEDFAVLRSLPATEQGDGGDVLELVHLAFPGEWDPRHKLGRDFAVVHAPVADNQVILRARPNIVRAMVTRGPFIRYTTSWTTDTELNHNPNRPRRKHEELPESVLRDPSQVATRVHVRWERQTTHPFPDLDRALFTIRTYVEPLSAVAAIPRKRAALASAIRTMTPDTLAYKGLQRLRDPMLAWLESGAGPPG